MAKRITPAALVVLLFVALALPATAPAKLPPISGKLSKRGYTVIALDARGLAKSVVAKKGGFKLRPTAKKVTLQLRAPNGTYAGPIVVGTKKRGKRALLGVRAGAKLGKVNVKPGKGYAKLKKRLAPKLAKKWLDAKRIATAKKGVPIGAGNFGRVAVAKLKGPSADSDLDGIPASLDVDDDGDLVLDDVDRNSAGGARAAQEGGSGTSAGVNTTMYLTGYLGLPPPVNVNAPGVSDAEIDAALRSAGRLTTAASGAFVSGELDCGGLSYCSAGGTGLRAPGELFEQNLIEPFPACCDPDRDGLGSLEQGQGGGAFAGSVGITLQPGASSEEIRTGDQLVLKLNCSSGCPGGKEEQTATLASVFATSTALASYTDEDGVTRAVPYPRPLIGAVGSALPVKDGSDPDSDVSVRLNFWRPQRRAIPKELTGTGKWIDMGGLSHHVWPAPTPGLNPLPSCPQSSYSGADSILEPYIKPEPEFPEFGFRDKALDQPANPANTFSFTINISQCYVPQAPKTGFGPGDYAALVIASGLQATVPGQPASAGANALYAFQYQP